MTTIIYNNLEWDNSHLGNYDASVIISKWIIKKQEYCEINIDNIHIRCIISKLKDMFPFIVEDIKDLFGIPKRGLHRIKIEGHEYLLQYVPVNADGNFVVETKLCNINSSHFLRKNDIFQNNVRKLLAFDEILSLSDTNESNIVIRPVDGGFIPVGINFKSTSIVKGKVNNVISKGLHDKWFGESMTISDTVGKMIITTSDNFPSVISDIREKIETIIAKYDSNYLWYICFIIDRLSNHLLYFHNI